jgi:hypothetical protein
MSNPTDDDAPLIYGLEFQVIYFYISIVYNVIFLTKLYLFAGYLSNLCRLGPLLLSWLRLKSQGL